MGGIYIDMEVFRRQMAEDCADLLGLFGIQMLAVCPIELRKSWFQRLRDEIAARPRVF